MTHTDTPSGNDQAHEDTELSLVSNLSVGLPGTQPEGTVSAEQGDAPADLRERKAPPVPTPSRDGLSAADVARLIGQDESGQDESTVDTNNTLDRAEGVVPHDED